MKAESTTLAGQRETTCHDKNERENSDLEISSWFPVVVLTCLFSFFSVASSSVFLSFLFSYFFSSYHVFSFLSLFLFYFTSSFFSNFFFSVGFLRFFLFFPSSVFHFIFIWAKVRTNQAMWGVDWFQYQRDSRYHNSTKDKVELVRYHRAYHRIGIRKISSPFIFVACVQLSLHNHV